MTGRKLPPKRARFAEEYLVDLNAAAAARRAGYSAKRADAIGHELLRFPEVAAAIALQQRARAERVQVTADDVLREWATIATANPAELVRYRVRACRHCHGLGHRYQWVSEQEWAHAVENARAAAAAAKRDPDAAAVPDNAGGYGYGVHLKPVADCFKCLGDGVTDVLLPDTRELSPAAARLYAGVKQTKEGIEVKMRNQDGALENLARHLGMFTDKLELSGRAGGPLQHVHMTADQFRAIATEIAGKV